MDEGHEIGRRLREIRHWRRLSLSVVAGLSGISIGHLSRIERGERPVTKRRTLEALANALRVSPTELTGQPFAPVDPLSNEAHASIAAVETALDAYDLGTDPGVPMRPWPELAAAVSHLNEELRAQADYAAQGKVLPGLLAELHAAYVRAPEHRRDALEGLVYAYRAAASVGKNLGARGLPMLAARLAQVCAEHLAAPEWIGFATYLRGIMGGQHHRSHQYALSTRTIDQISGSLSTPSVTQVTGTLHLNAALASAAQGDAERTRDHLAEAADLANRLPGQGENFAGLYFGAVNVGLWRVSLATELGEGARVAEYAHDLRPETIPLRSWQATYYMDLGRSLASERRTRERGIQNLMRAERIAPQFVRNNVFAREAVSGLLPAARRDAAGRELRGLAYRMGLAPTG
ncbi:helix-turn-helix domain-containing protein [Gandjariella thermophila]|uniref:Transcriptional regulator n=1 Tax=Gandjariella thermophila TaxID=1931992 RepID=A0A4D4JF90_9PSEU|nr:helix-turn-helix transcriptional regulator [Gandjariella thermophila]GDY33056.1 transcriptional regulator [Gandjariella thermophila]